MKVKKSCHADLQSGEHPDHTPSLVRLKRINGQLDGVERMINEGRYCPDILIQVRAAHSALRAFESTILERHLRHCVREAMESKKKVDVESKVQELMELFSRSL